MTYHQAYNGKLLEARVTPRSDFHEDNIFYLVQKVVIGTTEWFHHTVMLADTMDEVYGGILLVNADILADLRHAEAKIQPVLLGNLFMLDEELQSSADDLAIHNMMNEMLEEGVVDVFAVYGLISDMQITVMKVDAPDAFVAAANSVSAVHNQHGMSLLPLLVMNSAAAKSELKDHFVKCATNIRTLLDTSNVSH